MLDDLQDQDKDDMPWSQWPAQKAMPIALGALFAAQSCLAHLEAEPQTVSEIQLSWSESFLLASCGQAIIQNDQLLTYIERISANTGLMFGTTCWGGARLATTDVEILQTMQDFGIALGMAIQLGNDLTNLSRDLLHGHLTLAPLLALRALENPQHKRLSALLDGNQRLSSSEIGEVMEILRSTGALIFSLEVAQLYQAKALALLNKPVVAGGDTRYLRTYTHSLLSQHDGKHQS
jgi:geranylgeranyl pyrophosphate synthase